MQRANELDDMINTTGTVFWAHHRLRALSQSQVRSHFAAGLLRTQGHLRRRETRRRNLPLNDTAKTKTAAMQKRVGELKAQLAKFIARPAKANDRR